MNHHRIPDAALLNLIKTCNAVTRSSNRHLPWCPPFLSYSISLLLPTISFSFLAWSLYTDPFSYHLQPRAQKSSVPSHLNSSFLNPQSLTLTLPLPLPFKCLFCWQTPCMSASLITSSSSAPFLDGTFVFHCRHLGSQCLCVWKFYQLWERWMFGFLEVDN